MLKLTCGKERTLMFRALCRAIWWRAAWDDSNPEVGMGPSIETLAKKEAAVIGLDDPELVEEAAKYVKAHRQDKTIPHWPVL